MSKFSVVVVGVVYSGCEKYLNEYVKSLSQQTDREFDLMLVNDGMGSAVRNLFPSDTIWLDPTEKMTPAEIRQLLINDAHQRGYEQLIFTDTDDFYSNNRVACSKRHLKSCDFVFNEITLVNEFCEFQQENFLSSLKIGDEVNDYTALRDRNFIGLTNSALRLESVNEIYIPKDVIAVDWWIYTVLLIRGLRGKFIPEAVSFYRQYSDNLVGLPQKLTVEGLRRGVLVKLQHYSALVKYGDENNMKSVSVTATERLNQMAALTKQVEDRGFCERYIDKVNSNRGFFAGWWSEIVPFAQLKDGI